MTILWEGLKQGLHGVWTVARVVIPLMIILEIAQANGLLQRLNRVLARPFRRIGLSEEGAFPVVVAMVFGLTFGSGVILNHVQEGKITAREVKIMGTFIALAHALIEDTIIFFSLGAPLLLLLVPRLTAAYGMAYLVYRRGLSRGLPQGDRFKSVD
ncbi:MAG TPA: hypothetical protein GX521_09370 [Firmicutes bacterium]|nr:hypothetical protein [Bacillota bacterium]